MGKKKYTTEDYKEFEKFVRENNKSEKPKLKEGVIDGSAWLREQGINSSDYFAKFEGGYAIPQAGELHRLGITGFQAKDNTDYSMELAANQPFSEQFSRAITGGMKQVVGGFVDSVAAYDMEGMYDMAIGNKEKDYGNWLNNSDLAKWAKDMTGHEIYSYQDSMADTSYWTNMLQSLGYTGGIILETMAEQIALGSLTGGVGNVAGLASNINKLKSGGNALHGVFKGIQEAYMNGLETGESVYNKYKQLGYSEEESKRKGNEAATLGYRLEVGPLSAINALQFMTTFGRAKSAFNRKGNPELGFSGGIETALSGILPEKIASKPGIGLGLNMLSEGGEELIQSAVSKYAEHHVLDSTHDTSEVPDYIDIDSGVAGLLGGALFSGGGKLLNKFTEGTSAKKYSTAHDNFVQNATNRVAESFENKEKVTDLYNKAKIKYDKNKSESNLLALQRAELAVKEAQYNSHLTNTVNALNLDYINGKTTGFESHIEQMQDLLDAVNNSDIETLKKYNLIGIDGKEKYPGSFDIIKNNFEQNIKDSNLIKDKLENNLLNVTSDFQSALDITQKEYINNKHINEINNYNNSLDYLYNNDEQFKQLSNDGKNRFKLESELKSFDLLQNLSDINKQRKEEIRESLKNISEYNSSDKLIKDSIAENPFISGYTSIGSLREMIESNNKDLTKLKDQKEINKKVENRYKQSIQQAKTKEEVKEILEETKKTPNEEVLDKTITDLASIKNSEISAIETLKTVDPQFNSETNKDRPQENIKSKDSENTQYESDISSLLESGLLSSGGIEEQFTYEGEELPLSPKELDLRKLTEDKKNKLIEVTTAVANKLDRELGRPANFEDHIIDNIEKNTYDLVDNRFKGYEYAWNLIGRDTSNSQEVYNKFFRSNTIYDYIIDEIISEDSIIEDNENIVSTSIVENSEATSFNIDNRPTDKEGNYSQDFKTASPKAKAAFLGVQYVEIKNDNGTFSKIPIEAKLNQSENYGNFSIMNPDIIKPGVQLEIIIPDNINDIKVSDWSFNKENRWVKTDIIFGDWIKKNNIVIGSQEYYNKVPMIAKLGDNNAFAIHDTEWYNTSNIAPVENQLDIIQEGILELQQIRQEVIKGNNKIKVDSRNFGSIFKLNKLQNNNQAISITEATGDSKITIAKNFNEFFLDNKLNFVNKLDQFKLKPGKIYDIRQVNTLQDGTKQYIALETITNDPLKDQDINDTAYNNVKYSVISSVILNSKNNQTLLSELEKKYGMTVSKAKDIQSKIKENDRIDIQYSLGEYLSMFTHVNNRNSDLIKKLDSSEKSKVTGDDLYPSNINYLSFDNNVLKIVYKDGSPVKINERGFDNLPGINLNNITDASIPSILSIINNNFDGNNSRFRKTRFDINKDKINNKNSFSIISETGEIFNYVNKHGKNTYEGYIQDNLKTNIKSFEIVNSDGTTKWITDVQPVVTYSLSNNESATPIINENAIKDTLQVEIEKIELSQTNDVELVSKTISNEGLNIINETKKEKIEKAINLLPEDLKKDALKFLQGINFDNSDIDYNFSRREFTEEQNKELDNIQNTLISGLNPYQQKQLVNSLFNIILSDTKIDNDNINIADIVNKIKSSVENNLQPQIDKLNVYVSNLESLNNPGLEELISIFKSKSKQLETIIVEKDKIGGKSNPKGDLFKKFERFLGEDLSTYDDIVIEDNGESENSYDSSSLERNFKVSFSNSLKIFFSGIKKQKTSNKEDQINFSYLNDYVDVDDTIQSLTELMVGLPSNIDDLYNILETKKNDPTYNQILNKLRNTSDKVRNEILYKMIQNKLEMEMILMSIDKNSNTTSLKVINPNSSNSFVKLKQQWLNNFKNNLFKIVDHQSVYNKNLVNSLLSKIDKLAENKIINNSNFKEVKSILLNLGVDIGDNTINELIKQQGNNILSSSGIIGVFKNNLKNILATNKNLENIPLENNNPYDNASGVIENLIDLEIELNGSKVSKSFRVASKTYQGTFQKVMAYDIKEKLKDINSPYFKDLQKIPYSKNNFILEALSGDTDLNSKFRTNFDIKFISPEALKQNGQRSFGDKKINKLPEVDSIITEYGLFQNTTRTLGKLLDSSNLNFRMGYKFNSTLSDKEQMLLYNTALLDLTDFNFNINGNIVELSTEVLDFITNQIYESEFDRIVSIYNNPTTIKNYDNAAKRFISIPRLNTLTSNEGANIHDAIKIGYADQNTMDNLKESFKLKARNIIKEIVENIVNSNIDIENNTGTWFEDGFIQFEENKYIINYFDSKYLASKKSSNKNLTNDILGKIAAYDFVVNQLLHQNNLSQLVSGDLALYAPSIKKFTNKETGNIDNLSFSKAIGESLLKRSAMLIAPGNKLANSLNDKYLQVFLNDPIKSTSTSRELIKQYYGEVSDTNNKLLGRLDKIENDIQNLYKSGTTIQNFDNNLNILNDERDFILKELQDNNEAIAGYFEIEGTDAQEYTTWKEHIDVLFRQGRLNTSDEIKLKSAYNKLLKGEDLNKEELGVVMNPIKPVYSGSITELDKNGNPLLNRIVYIKSSSFPLLPQLTKDFKLDKIRQQMESLEKVSNKNVRLSYQTANKVGAINSTLSVNDLYNISFEDLYDNGSGKLYQNTLELDRDNFKIQQDTPYKTAKNLKNNSEDSVTMGSQMWKIILGSGINSLDSKIFPNIFGAEAIDFINSKVLDDKINTSGNISGRDLDKIKFEAEKEYFNIQKDLLYDELGLDRTTRQPIDTNNTIKKLYELLQRETAARQYPDSIVDGLQLTYTKDQLEFIIPLWLSSSSNKFESLLQAIITNRLIQIKLPGNQHISSSSEGFEKISELSEVNSKIKSEIVWIDPNHTGELKATYLDNGILKESEILIQSKFRKTTTDENGKKVTKLIDLTKAPYSTIENGVLVLNKEMIEDSLLSYFSFRIPTSSHQSGAILKVVGFLPEASGDMIVVPKEHTKQIGEDYDIDKRTLYKSNYFIDQNDKIKKLEFKNFTNEEIADDFLNLFNDDILNDVVDKERYKKSKYKIKQLENVIIDVYKSVYMSTDNNIQKNINKILSFDNASNTANLIYNRLNSSIDNTNFTLYSDKYQRDQMKLGADGKIGIGQHSNAVTLQAQMERLVNKLVIQTPTKSIDKVIYNPVKITIGNYTSNGKLGSVETLDKSRTIGEVHGENQNSSTDNTKAQIMGKRNENQYTMGVLTQLTFRGFDMVDFTPRNENQPNKVQVSSLFISQPIIRRYVELKEKAKSIISDFNNTDTDIINTLLEEFNPNNTVEIKYKKGQLDKFDFLKSNLYVSTSRQMTGDKLYDNLINQKDLKTWDSATQLAVLQTFFILEEESKVLSEYQQLINMSTTGLGISYFNVLDRIEVLNKMVYEDRIANLKDLVGDFIDIEDFTDNPPVDKESYTRLGEFFIKPTTTEGTVLIQSLSSAKDLLDNIFPYNSNFIKNSIDTIKNNKNKDLSKNQSLELQYKIVSNIKDYIYSTENTGLFSGNIDQERYRLFFDKENNISLSSYLKSLKDSKKYPILYTNELLKSLDFIVNKDGSPSIIRHTSSIDTNFDKTDKYNSFLELLQDNKTDLGIYNGEQITPRKLAQDLASYAYLANSENGAIGFKELIHVDYLNISQVSQSMRDISTGRFEKNTLFENNSDNFVKQFYQHNPEESFILSSNNSSIDNFELLDNKSNKLKNQILSLNDSTQKNLLYNKFLTELEEFYIKLEEQPAFISIRNTGIKLSDNKFNLYQFINDKYVRIPTLGTFGFNEYNPNNFNQRSLIYPEVGVIDIRQNTTELSEEIKNKSINIKDYIGGKEDVKSVLEKIIDKSDKFRNLANQILPFIDPSIKFKIETIQTSKGELKLGTYRKSDNTIYINPNIVDNLNVKNNFSEDVFEVVMEEILHSITINQIDKFGKILDGQFIPNNDAPVFVTKLSRLFNLSKEKFPDEYYNKNIYEFIAGVFVSEDFKNLLDNTKEGSKSLLDIFKDVVSSMVRFITGSTYSDVSRNTIFEMLKYNQPDAHVIGIKSVLDSMKKSDVEMKNEISNIKSNILDNDVRIISKYNPEISKEFIRKFDNGEILTTSTSQFRKPDSPEFQYIKDLLMYISNTNNVKITTDNVSQFINTIKTNESSQTIQKTIENQIEENQSNDLPIIKKC